MTLVLRSKGDPMALLPAVKTAIWSVTKDQRVSGDAFTLEGLLVISDSKLAHHRTTSGRSGRM
jgi:hypothetical protein